MHQLPSNLPLLQSKLRSGELSEHDALELQRQAIQERASSLDCVVTTWDETLPICKGPLTGITLAHKDIFDLPGRAPGLGINTGVFDSSRSRAWALETLAKAGATQWATLAMSPHACGATGQNPHFSRVRNPIDEKMALGGSSSGSAAAVAAGLSYFSLGTDTAGSIRIPAATCGLIGLKTTHGLIDTRGCAPLAPSLDSIGVLARNPQDVKVALEILAPGLNIERKLFPRIKAWIPLEKVDDEIYACTSKWLANYSIQTIDLTEQMQFLSVMAQRVLCFEVAQTHRQALKLKQAEADVETLGLIGMAMPEAWYREAMDQRGHWLSVFVQNVFESADILVLPSLPFCVPDWDVVQVGEERFNVRQLLALHHFMGFVNYLGLPSMSLPIGRDSNGRPVSVQLLTRPFSEHVLLELATQSHDTFFSFFKTP